jgi:predicted RNA binding protein YcfA (HicA-like mRNA interferase family)
MATTSELIRRLQRAGFQLARHGKRHDIYENPITNKRVSVPRHAKELPNGTYRAILRDAGISDG